MVDYSIDDLQSHVGHTVVCVQHGEPDDPDSVTVECEDCDEVLLDARGNRVE